MSGADINVDPVEVSKFDAMAARWWDPEGEMAPLHLINPIRTDYVNRCTPLENLRALDVGCGGGLLSESLSESGATVTGIDASESALKVARLHASMSGLSIEYLRTSCEAFAAQRASEGDAQAQDFDVVTCMELLEHVPDPGSLVTACAGLLRPGGTVYFSTINRNPKAYAVAIVGAEYVLRMLPRGTHDYAKLIRPSELARWGRLAGLRLDDLCGIVFDPLTRRFKCGDDVSINYVARFSKPLAT